MKKIHERLFHFDRLGTTLLVCMHFAERSKIFLSVVHTNLRLSLIFEIPKATEANQPAAARRRNGFALADPRAAASQEPPPWRLQSPQSRVSIPNIPSGREKEDEEEKQRRRGSAERSGNQSCSTGKRQNVRRPTGPGATFTTCEGGAVEPFIPNHRTNLLGWYRGGVEVWVVVGFILFF